MDIKTYKTAGEFLAHAGKHLAKDEARYGLTMGLVKRLVENPHYYGEENPWFCTTGMGNKVNAAAMRTPPHTLILAHLSGAIEAVAEKLVQAVINDFNFIPGVVGDKELADTFAMLWCEKCGAKIVNTMAQRIYRLDKVNNVPASPGRFRLATMAEKELVKKWAHAFHLDTFGEGSNAAESDITPALEHNAVFFWELQGRPVSMAVKMRPTDKGMSVGCVYTPPELRGKGYATSCVAELSRSILQSGRGFCMLYTDMANPTSNSIYKKIGYNPVCDSVEHSFEMMEKI
jgi:predicted GNAT family acetyltransferase